MARAPAHPSRDQIQLPLVLECLSDPTRLAIVCSLAGQSPNRDLCCGDFSEFSGKSNLAYHFAKLREAGVTLTRLQGTTRYITLRRDDLDALFPGLLDTVIGAATANGQPWLPEGCRLLCDRA